MNDLVSTIRWYMSQGLSFDEAVEEIRKIFRVIDQGVINRARGEIENVCYKIHRQS